MVDSADQARAIATLAGAALRLVNEVAAASLIAAADRGETRARVDIEPVRIAHAAGRVGRLYDRGLVEALEGGGERWLARACRIFAALGFAVATAPETRRREEIGGAVDAASSIGITHLELGFSSAEEIRSAATAPLLQAVALPAAHLWRSRAETARRIERYERKALAVIAEEAERGNASCRLPWRAFGSGQPDVQQLQRLAERLRGRGFRVEQIEPGAVLRVFW